MSNKGGSDITASFHAISNPELVFHIIIGPTFQNSNFWRNLFKSPVKCFTVQCSVELWNCNTWLLSTQETDQYHIWLNLSLSLLRNCLKFFQPPHHKSGVVSLRNLFSYFDFLPRLHQVLDARQGLSATAACIIRDARMQTATTAILTFTMLSTTSRWTIGSKSKPTIGWNEIALQDNRELENVYEEIQKKMGKRNIEKSQVQIILGKKKSFQSRFCLPGHWHTKHVKPYCCELICIPHICHFFTLTHFQAWKFYTQKRVNLRQKLPRDKTA